MNAVRRTGLITLGLTLAACGWAQDGVGARFRAEQQRVALLGLVALEGGSLTAQPTGWGLGVGNSSCSSFAESEGKKRSPGRAFLLSLLLPGLGEPYCGASSRGWAFTAAEALLWAGFVSFRLYGDWRTEDYRAYAATYAGVDPEGKSHRYFVDIGNYISIEAYNAAMLRERNLARLYLDTEAYHWAWQSDVQRVRYAHLRVGADNAYQRSVLVVGAIIANHLASAIDAMWVAKRSKRSLPQGGLDLDVHFGWSSAGATLLLSAAHQF